jgi:hypothetical protein
MSMHPILRPILQVLFQIRERHPGAILSMSAVSHVIFQLFSLNENHFKLSR